jgi:hypothetical protein
LARTQLAINCPQPLLDRLRAEAEARGVTVTSLVLAWVTAGLDGGAVPPAEAPRSDLGARLDAIERRLDGLTPKPRNTAPPRAPSPVICADPPADGIPTIEVADRMGCSRTALNERVRRAGGAVIGLEIDGWRIVGKAIGSNGGPPRWLWSQT